MAVPGGDLVAQGQVRPATKTLSGVLHGKDASFLPKARHTPLLLRELETTLSDRGQETQVTLSGSRHFTGQAERRSHHVPVHPLAERQVLDGGLEHFAGARAHQFKRQEAVKRKKKKKL